MLECVGTSAASIVANVPGSVGFGRISPSGARSRQFESRPEHHSKAHNPVGLRVFSWVAVLERCWKGGSCGDLLAW
jgi:hypothetical protein